MTIQYYKKLSDVEPYLLILELMKKRDIDWEFNRDHPYRPFTFSIILSTQAVEKLGKEQDYRDIMQGCWEKSKQINKEIIESGDFDRIDQILRR